MPPLVEAIQRSGAGSWIEVRLDRLISNLNSLKQYSSRSAVMAVVKANAYGHGIVEVSRALAGHVSYLGVSSLYEAIELSEHGIETPVFLFGRLFGPELVTAVQRGFALSVSSFDEAREISEIAFHSGKSAAIHVKIDTGMGRMGIPVERAMDELEKIFALTSLHTEGIFTHFPAAERRDAFCEMQLQKLALLLRDLETSGIRFQYRHAANSAASLLVKSPILNLIRPGILLYGIYPDASLKSCAGFTPVLTLKSRIILVKRLETGESVGYGRDFVAARPTTVATLPIGYSHGYPFHLSNRSWVLYKGGRYPLAGRVSMDYLTVNLGDTPARAGDEVTLLGEDGGESIQAEDLARWAGTIPYEIVTRLSPRLPRFYQL